MARRCRLGDSPPIVNVFEGGAVTPRRGCGQARRCFAKRPGGSLASHRTGEREKVLGATVGPLRELAPDPLSVGSQPTLWGHASRVPGRGWRGWLHPLRSPGRPRSGRPWRARGRQVARIGGNLNHLVAVSGLVERRRRPHWDDLPSHLAGEKPRPAAGFVDTPRSQRRLMAFPLGIAGGERPPGEGGMGVHMPTLRDADRGIPKGGVAPFFGRKLRSGVAAPAAVPQLQDR